MKSRSRIILLIVMLGVVLVGVTYFVRQHTGSSGRRVIAERIILSEIQDLEVKSVEDPVLHSYAYEKNEFRAIPSLAGERLNTMDGGQLPAFEFNGFKFLVLHKWVNFSWGVAYGLHLPPESPPEFSFEPVSNGLWIWTLDLERQSPST